HQIGEFDQLRRRVAAGHDHVLTHWPMAQDVEHLAKLEPAVLETVGDLVEDHDVVGAALDRGATALPASPGERAIDVEVLAEPGEAAAERNNLDAHFLSGARFTPVSG